MASLEVIAEIVERIEIGVAKINSHVEDLTERVSKLEISDAEKGTKINAMKEATTKRWDIIASVLGAVLAGVVLLLIQLSL